LRALQKLFVLLLGLGLSSTAWADDPDGDGYDDLDGSDNCPGVYNDDQADSDCDGEGDACQSPDHACLSCCDAGGDFDYDDDGVDDDVDNCYNAPNADQADSDCDGAGDECDFVDDDLCGGGDDADGDTVADDGDNCPDDYNPDQDDEDCDAYGDVCDLDSHDGPCGDHDWDEDGVPEELDLCPDDDATDHDLYTDGCVDTIQDFSPFIRTLEISRRSAETALTTVADSAADSAERGRTLIAHFKLRALGNLANALNRTSLITDEQNGLIHQFSDDVGDDL
jgi:hypothetical protein